MVCPYGEPSTPCSEIVAQEGRVAVSGPFACLEVYESVAGCGNGIEIGRSVMGGYVDAPDGELGGVDVDVRQPWPGKTPPGHSRSEQGCDGDDGYCGPSGSFVGELLHASKIVKKTKSDASAVKQFEKTRSEAAHECEYDQQAADYGEIESEKIDEHGDVGTGGYDRVETSSDRAYNDCVAAIDEERGGREETARAADAARDEQGCDVVEEKESDNYVEALDIYHSLRILWREEEYCCGQ